MTPAIILTLFTIFVTILQRKGNVLIFNLAIYTLFIYIGYKYYDEKFHEYLNCSLFDYSFAKREYF